jgi:glycyl-tRNA synthetase
MASKFDFEKITSHLQLTGYVYPGSQIYGGLSNSWDYGPLGAELKKNIKVLPGGNAFVQESPMNVGLIRPFS